MVSIGISTRSGTATSSTRDKKIKDLLTRKTDYPFLPSGSGGNTGGGSGGGGGGLPPGVNMSTREGYVLETGETVPISETSRQAIIYGARTAAEVQAYIQQVEAQRQQRLSQEQEKQRAAEIERQMNESINKARADYQKELRSLTSQQDRLKALNRFSQKVYEARVKTGQERVSSGIVKSTNVIGTTINKKGTTTLIEKQLEKVRSGEIKSYKLDDGTVVTRDMLNEVPGIPGVSQQPSTAQQFKEELARRASEIAETKQSRIEDKPIIPKKDLAGYTSYIVGEFGKTTQKAIEKTTGTIDWLGTRAGEGFEIAANRLGMPTITSKMPPVTALELTRGNINPQNIFQTYEVLPARTEEFGPKQIGSVAGETVKQAIYFGALEGGGELFQLAARGNLLTRGIKLTSKTWRPTLREAEFGISDVTGITKVPKATGGFNTLIKRDVIGGAVGGTEGRIVTAEAQPNWLGRLLGKEPEVIYKGYPYGNAAEYNQALARLQPALSKEAAKQAVKFTRGVQEQILFKGEVGTIVGETNQPAILLKGVKQEQTISVDMFQPKASPGATYHGTSSKVLAPIKRIGLVPGSQTGNYRGIATPRTFVSAGTTPDVAKGFAGRTAIKAGGKPVILEINIPRNKLNNYIIKSPEGTAIEEVRFSKVPSQYIKEFKAIKSTSKPTKIFDITQPGVEVSEVKGVTEYLSNPRVEFTGYLTPEKRLAMKISQAGKTAETFKQVSRVKSLGDTIFQMPSGVKGVDLGKPAELFQEASISRKILSSGRLGKQIPSTSKIYVVETGGTPVRVSYEAPFTYRNIPTSKPLQPVKLTGEQAQKITNTLQNIYGKPSKQEIEKVVGSLPKIDVGIKPAKAIKVDLQSSKASSYVPTASQSAYYGKGLYEQSIGGILPQTERIDQGQRIKPMEITAEVSRLKAEQRQEQPQRFEFKFKNAEKLVQPTATEERLVEKLVQPIAQEQKQAQKLNLRSSFSIRTPKTPRPNRPSPPKPIIRLPSSIVSKAKSLLENLRSYDVFTYKGGKEVRIGKSLPLGKATKLGVETTLSTLRASFKLKPTGYTTGYDINYKAPSRLFGPSKRDINRLVQRRGTRLSARTEVLEIQQAKRSKSRRLKWF